MAQEGRSNDECLVRYLYTKTQVIEMRNLYKKGVSQKEIQKQFGISQPQVSGILTYKFWKHI